MLFNFSKGKLIQVGVVELFNSYFNIGGYLSDFVII
jgi:hypothetical protein